MRKGVSSLQWYDEVHLELLRGQERRGAGWTIHLPQRCNGPAGSEDVVIKTLTIATVVPVGVLNNLGVEAWHANAAEALLGGQ